MHRKLLCIFFFASLFSQIQAQDVFELTGTLTHNKLSVADVHVINKTFDKYTITDENGRFELMARIGDTIVFSSIQFNLKNVVLESKQSINITLVERVNELDEVVLYNKLSGDPAMDMKNSEVKKQINFYDIGIPGYTGRKLTQPERKLFEATSGGGILPLNPILNAITGRTKMLKERVKLQKKFASIDAMEERYQQLFIDVYKLPQEKAHNFFDFCSDDVKFMSIANGSASLDQLDFFITKYKEYEKRVMVTDE